MDIQPGHDGGLRELALFAGAGGGILGGKLLGWQTVCAVEWDAYAAGVLVARQNDGILAPFPIWDDVQTFDGRPWRGRVDVVSGGFPCQDISCAGKGAGIDGERSGMWSHMARIIGEVRPRYAFIENSPMLVTRGLDRVLADLAALRFDAEWGTLSAADVGAPHKRDRIWILARNMGDTYDDGQTTTEIATGAIAGGHDSAARTEQTSELARSGQQYAELADTNSTQRTRLPSGAEAQKPSARIDGENEVADTTSQRQQGPRQSIHASDSAAHGKRQTSDAVDVRIRAKWPPEPSICRVVDGLASRVDELRAIGNGQVPRVAAAAFEQLRARNEK